MSKRLYDHLPEHTQEQSQHHTHENSHDHTHDHTRYEQHPNDHHHHETYAFAHIHKEPDTHDHTDDPAIFSEAYKYDFPEKVSAQKIQQVFYHWLEEMKEWASSNGCFIGHIKIFVESKENLWLSSTGRSINVKQSSGWSELLTESITLNVTAIIFGTTKEALGKVAETKLQDCLAR